jgi:hypothetical protein
LRVTTPVTSKRATLPAHDLRALARSNATLTRPEQATHASARNARP